MTVQPNVRRWYSQASARVRRLCPFPAKLAENFCKISKTSKRQDSCSEELRVRELRLRLRVREDEEREEREEEEGREGVGEKGSIRLFSSNSFSALVVIACRPASHVADPIALARSFCL
jgi:hypothetical protein